MADRTERIGARMNKRVMLSAALVKEMGISPEAYTRVALNALVTNPKIADCTVESIDAVLLRCIEIGLLPDGKHAAIVPYKGKAQLIIMIDGKATLARRATRGLALRSRVVYAGEEFRHVEGLDVVLEHIPDETAPRGAEHVRAAYAVADIPGGAKEWVVLYRTDLEKAAAFSARGWKDQFWPEMAEKTALHRVLKRLPTVPDAPPDFDEIEAEPEPEQPRVVGPALPAPDPDAYIPPAEPAERPAEPVPAQRAAAQPAAQQQEEIDDASPF